MMTAHHVQVKGLIFGVLAGVVWGFVPLVYWPLRKISPWELVCYRVIFADIFLIILIFFQYKNEKFFEALKMIAWPYVFMVSIILGVWWLTFVYATTVNRVTEIALGYFLSPLLCALIATLVLKEKLSFLGKLALLFAGSGVLLLIILDMHQLTFPWIGCVVGGSYSACAVLKKHMHGDALFLQFIEVSILMPFAILILLILSHFCGLYHWNQGIKINILIISLGLITVLPFLWFSLASKKLPLLSSAFLQFISPTLEFICAVKVFQEKLTFTKLIVFLLIWIGVILFLLDLILKFRRRVC